MVKFWRFLPKSCVRNPDVTTESILKAEYEPRLGLLTNQGEPSSGLLVNQIDAPAGTGGARIRLQVGLPKYSEENPLINREPAVQGTPKAGRSAKGEIQ